MLNTRQDCIKTDGADSSGSELPVPSGVQAQAKIAHGRDTQRDPHESDKLEEVTPGSKMGSPVPRCRNWNPWGEVV